ncbi:MAG: efflux RND transporter periplasmic adaptor subunit [Fibrobacter sp.]|jgi:RND family efflux transporter MFP subunit|nr:efflux RND transporter periplasmic adaptor subunit [Fibrobacter sp.]
MALFGRFLLLCLLFSSVVQARSFDGITEAIESSVMGMTVSGRVDSIWVSEGTFVRKGDIILNLNKENEEIQVGVTRLILESKADLNAARTKMEIYQKDYLATKKLFETSTSVSEEQVWEKELAYKSAVSEYEKLQMAEEKEELEYQMALVQLEEKILRAPFDGVIVRIGKNKSESVEALEPFVEIADVRVCRMISYVLAPNAASLKKGQTVQLQLDGAKKKRYKKGKIEFISPVVDKSSMLRTVKVIFDNKDQKIEPGVTGKILLK